MRIAGFLRNTVTGFTILVALWAWETTSAIAEDLSEPSRVVNAYVASLINGDTQQLTMLIDGKMKKNNKQLVLNPDTYSRFLRDYYKGVNAVLEDVVPEGSRMRARVRFEYPAQDSSTIDFILAKRAGEWRIVDEVY
jgi:predicted ester cyclase